MSVFAHHPSLRFVLPLIGGIVWGNYWYEQEIDWVGVGLPSLVFLWAILWMANRKCWLRLFGWVAALWFFVAGWWLVEAQLRQGEVSFPAQRTGYQLVMVDHPVEKARSYLCKAVLEGWWTDSHRWHRAASKPEVWCYLAKDTTALPSRGDRLWVYTTFRRPMPSTLPDAFNYARYLRLQGVSGTAYVAAHHWKRVGREETRTLKQLALDARAQVVALYQRLGFRGDELAVLSALTVGDKTALGEEIQATYSIAGASHVLALSGLHVGLIYGLLFFLAAGLWKRWPWLKWPLTGVIIGLLGCFAFFTGLSVSVIRAVVMCSLCLLLSFRRGRVLTFDTLLATAFLLLLYQPLWLFDVSFQLSFSAVAAILLLYPKLRDAWPFHSCIGQKIGELLVLSLAAQVGTAPLILYYFSHFSTYFLLTNLWVIPGVTVLLYVAVVLLALTPFPALQTEVATWLSALIQLQHQGLSWIEHLPSASFHIMQLDAWEVGVLYLLLGAGYRYLLRPLAARVWVFLGWLCVWGTIRLGCTLHDAPQPGMLFYADRGRVAVHCLTEGTHSWLVSPDSLSDSLAWHRSLQPYWHRWRLASPHWVRGSYAAPTLRFQEQLLFYRGKSLCLLTDHRWQHRHVRQPLPVDYLYVSPGYRGSLRQLSDVFRLHTVFLPDSLSNPHHSRWQAECQELGLTCVWPSHASRFMLP